MPLPKKALTEEEERLLMEQASRQAGPRYAPTPPGLNDATPPAVKAPTPIYSPSEPILDESALIKRPTQPYPASVNPVTGTMSAEDRMAITRPRIATAAAPVAPTVAPASGSMPVYGAHGQPLGAEGGDDFENQQTHLRALQTYKPTDNNGRVKSALLAFSRGFQGVPGHSLLSGLIDPSLDEQYANEREIARVGRGVQTEMASRKAQSALADDVVDRDYKRAQAQRVLNPVYAPIVVDSDKGAMLVDRSKGVANPVYDPQGNAVKKTAKPGATKYEVRHNAETGVAEKWQIGANGEPDKKVEGWSDPAKNLVKRDGMWVPQGTALTASALGEQRQYGRNRDVKLDTRHELERAEDKTQIQQDKLSVRKEKAGKLVGSLEGARTRWIAADAKVSELNQRMQAETDPDKKQSLADLISRWEYDRSIAQREAADAATELGNSHGDLFEAGIGDRGLAYYKRKPFNVKTWRTKYPKATAQQEAAAIQNATDMGMEIVK